MTSRQHYTYVTLQLSYSVSCRASSPAVFALVVSVPYLDAGFQEASVGQKVIVALFGNILQNRRLSFLAKGTRSWRSESPGRNRILGQSAVNYRHTRQRVPPWPVKRWTSCDAFSQPLCPYSLRHFSTCRCGHMLGRVAPYPTIFPQSTTHSGNES